MKAILKTIFPKSLLKFYSKYKQHCLEKNYKGQGVICVICHAEYKIFRPYGLIARKNAKCPNCGSLERHRLIYKFFIDKDMFVNPDNSLKVLHFAPERVFYDFFKSKPHIEYTPCDLNPNAYTYDDMQKVDITDIPFEDNVFDFILCNHVLEHIPDDNLAMSELFRVMKPGGQGIFQVPIKTNLQHTYEDFSIVTPEGRERAFGQYDHVRLYGLDYKNRLEAAGFIVNLDDFLTGFSISERYKYGFPSNEVIYNCKKANLN